VPGTFTLYQNYPNPFNHSTEIRFDLAEEASVRLVVYNVQGQEVARLAHGPMQAGTHVVSWHAEGLPGGVYYYRLQAGSFRATQSLVLLK
jgi:hypothetical protein